MPKDDLKYEESAREKALKRALDKKACPACYGRGYDEGSSSDDVCSHCGGSGKYKPWPKPPVFKGKPREL